jgi:hypothetical protein
LGPASFFGNSVLVDSGDFSFLFFATLDMTLKGLI